MGSILAVDDEKGILFALGDYLGQHGYSVQSASNIDAAKNELTSRSYDVAIVDLGLEAGKPESGMALVRHLRENCQQTRVIVLTGCASDAVEREARLLGVDAFLSKPQPMALLLTLVETLVGKVDRGRALASEQVGPAERKRALVVDSSVHAELRSSQPVLAAGLEPKVVSRIADALEEIPRLRPSMILVQAESLSLDGEANFPQLKAHPELGDVPLVLIASRETPPELIESAWNAGADDCILGPVRMNHVQARLAAVSSSGERHSSALSAARVARHVVVVGPEDGYRSRLCKLLELNGFRLLSCCSLEAANALDHESTRCDLLVHYDPTAAEDGLQAIQELATRLNGASPVPWVAVVPLLAGERTWKVKPVAWVSPDRPLEDVVRQAQGVFNRSDPGLRASERVPFYTLVEFREPSGADQSWCSSYSFNLSPGGIFLKTLVPGRPGAAVELRIHLATTREVLDGTGIVAWANRYVRRTTYTYPVGMGVQFLGMSPKRLGQLREICAMSVGLS